MIKTIKENVVYEGKFYTVLDNDVLFNKETKGKYFKLIPTGIGRDGVIVLPLTKNLEVVIQDEYRYGIEDYITQLVAGGIPEGYTPEEAALMELEEEMSLECSELVPLSFFLQSPSMMDSKAYVYIALNCKPKKNAKPQEETEFFKNRKIVNFNTMHNMVLNEDIKCLFTQMIILKAFYKLKDLKIIN